MNKKVTDILPPKEIGKKEVEEEVLEKKPQPKFKKPKIKISLPPFKKGLIFAILILVLGICYFTLSKAEIEIWPETEVLTLETKLTVDKTVAEPDFSAKVIPGEIFEKEKTVASIFPASGIALKEGKSRGTIKVYNAYSTYSQVLVERTRFVSADGKVFRIPSKITVPGGHYEKGKLVPGEIDIEAVADQPGPEYNIGPSTFSIPGFAGTDRYTKFYAKSFQSMEGGSLEEVPKVTKEDLEEAEDSLVKQAKKESEFSFRNELQSEEISSEFYFLEDSIRTEILEKFSLAQPEDELEEFNFQVKAKSKTLLFKREDLISFAKESLLPYLPEGKKLYQESLKIDYFAETINLDSGKIILSLKLTAKAYSDVDLSNLKNNLGGKSLKETKIFLENQPKIIKVEVKFWPFWVGSVPENPEKVKLKLNID